MKAVGEILKDAREKKGLTLAEVARITKIRDNFLEALEENKFDRIAEATVVKGFIKNYAEYLGLSARDVLAVFRRDFIEDKKGQILPRGAYEPLDRPAVIWTPRLTVVLVISLIVLLFASYLASQVLGFLGAPPLTVSSPKDGQVVKESYLEVIGKTDADASIFINGGIITIAKDGSFKEEISLSPGDNIIKIEAVSRRAKKTIKEISIKYEGP